MELSNIPTNILASQEIVNLTALSSNDNGAMPPTLDQITFPRSCVLSGSISKDGCIAFASGGFMDVWKGRYEGNAVCIKAFRTYSDDSLSKIKQRLFEEILTWRKLEHRNVLPVLGITPELFTLCLVSEWMINGNIMDVVSGYPEVNRFRLLAEAASGVQYLHSVDIIHGDLKPANILIDGNLHARLTDYGLSAIISDPNVVDPSTATSPSVEIVQCMAPELLHPPSFCLMNSHPTRESDIYAFGVVTYRVVTGQIPFPGTRASVVVLGVLAGKRPGRPPSMWASNGAWNVISSSWCSSRDNRPDIGFIISTLSDEADAIEVRRMDLNTTSNRGGSAPCDTLEGGPDRTGGLLGPDRDGAPTQRVHPLAPRLATSPSPSPLVVKTPTGSRTWRKGSTLQQRRLRPWHDSGGLHGQAATLVEYETNMTDRKSVV